jgi:Vacuolar membrane-associated protein Iml1
MIEIRVWDPQPPPSNTVLITGLADTSGVWRSGALAGTSGMPPGTSDSQSTMFLSDDEEGSQNTAPSAAQPSATAGSDSPLTAPGGSSNFLPPAYPRPRAATGSDTPASGNVSSQGGGASPAVLLTAKPLPVQRRDSGGAATTSIEHSARRHHREISDVTVETISGLVPTPTVPDHSDRPHPIANLQLPSDTPLPQHPQAAMLRPTQISRRTSVSRVREEDTYAYVERTHTLRLSFVMKVTERTFTSLKGSARTQISLLRPVADLYELSSFDKVTVHRIPQNEERTVHEAVSADFVLVTIKDQFISRGDMHYFQQHLIGSWIYEGQRLSEETRGVHAHAKEIRHKGYPARSGEFAYAAAIPQSADDYVHSTLPLTNLITLSETTALLSNSSISQA